MSIFCRHALPEACVLTAQVSAPCKPKTAHPASCSARWRSLLLQLLFSFQLFTLSCSQGVLSVIMFLAALKGAVTPAQPRRQVTYIIAELVKRMKEATDWLVGACNPKAYCSMPAAGQMTHCLLVLACLSA